MSHHTSHRAGHHEDSAPPVPRPALPRLSIGDAAVVLAQYDLPAVHAVRALAGGQAARLETRDGSLLLKRRPASRASHLSRVHLVVDTIAGPLDALGIIVPTPKRTARGETMALAQGWVYDIAPWIEGHRFDGAPATAAQAGAALALVHQALRTPRVAAIAPELSAMRSAGEPGADEQVAADALHPLRRDLSLWLEREGVWSGTSQVLHGDWHRGNVLFDPVGRAHAVLDFELTSTGPVIAEVASGAVQFATEIRTGPAAHWPAETDLATIEQFVAGYREARPARRLGRRPGLLKQADAKAAPVLMAHALLMQAAELDPGEGSLTAAVVRKARWLLDRQVEITHIFMP